MNDTEIGQWDCSMYQLFGMTVSHGVYILTLLFYIVTRILFFTIKLKKTNCKKILENFQIGFHSY